MYVSVKGGERAISAAHKLLAEERRWFDYQALQVEYTQLAEYGGDVLVEHDVTFDLFTQIARRERTFSTIWDAFRWRRFEKRAVARYDRVVVMSEKDAEMLGKGEVIPNGVDLQRFRGEPETAGERLLFIYGEYDPWTAGAFALGSAQDSFTFTVPAGSHGARIRQLSAPDRQLVQDILSRWAGRPVVVGSSFSLTSLFKLP